MSDALSEFPLLDKERRRSNVSEIVQNVLRRRLLHTLCLASLCLVILLHITHETEYSVSSLGNKITAAIPEKYNPLSALPDEYNPLSPDLAETPAPPAPIKRNLHLLLPADHTDENLCKAVASSLVLGYPAATIVNWQVTFDVYGQAAGGSHLGKLTGINKWLKTLPEDRDDDLVIVADAYDVWFQLRPEVLIERYYDINRRANERLRAELGQSAVQKYGIEQSIVFSAQKKCGFGALRSPYCDIVPHSTLPDDVFGPETDVQQKDTPNPDMFRRPRTLCSGTFTGRVGPLRKLFAEAAFQAKENPNTGSDQRVLSYIFGEQEIWRSTLRLNKTGVPNLERLTPEGPFEFGLGLDYESSTGIPTVFAEEDLDWVSYSDATRIHRLSDALNLSPPHLPKRFAKDIERSRLPFANVTGKDAELRETEWNEVSLLTNLYTGFAPVMIHHNAWRDGLKSRRETWWGQPWFYRYLRPLLNGASKARNNSTIATVTDDKGQEVVFERVLASGAGQAYPGLGAVSGKGEFLSWGKLCDDFDDSVFRDGRGHWKDPVP